MARKIAIVIKDENTTEIFFPDWFEAELVRFIEQNQTSGFSVAGTDEQIIAEMTDYLKK